MTRIAALLLVVISAVRAAEDHAENCRPTFALAFHTSESSKDRVETLNKQSGSGTLPFPGKLSGSIVSEGVRIGGELLGLKGTYYDPDSQCIMHVVGSVTLSGPRFAFDCFPAGDYLLVLEVQGSTAYSKRIHLPFSEQDAKDFKVIIPKPIEITGSVGNIPIWSLESPLVGSGPALSTIDKGGHFKFSTPAQSTDGLVVKVRFPNSLPNEWGQPLMRFEFHFARGASPQSLTLPEIGNWKVSVGRAKFEGGLPKTLKPVLQNLSIIATASDGELVYRCNPDTDGKFLIIGIPDGNYSITVDDFGNPPFIVDPVPLSVVDHKADQVELVLHAHGAKK
jgi:hypothetical protein